MIEGLFTLPKDILLEPVESLPEAVLAGFEHQAGDFALTRPQSRTPTHIVNDSTAMLLQFFREPVTIVDAIISFSKVQQADPSLVLEEAFTALRPLIEGGMLLPSGSQLISGIEFLIAPGELVGELIVVEPVAILIDTEVYRARASDGSFAALKIGRPGFEGRLKAALKHEARILRLLDGCCSPKYIAQGEYAGRPYLAMEWCQGVDVFTAAELVRNRDPARKRELKAILLAVVAAYARLHEQFVLHGDVHPRNLVMCDSGAAVLLDFGQALDIRDHRASAPPGRGIVDLYMEPELASVRLDGGKVQPPTVAGEQYSIAALLYFLIAGTHTHDFALEAGQMLRQVVNDAPRTFAEREVFGFANTERVLLKALEKRPETRFASVSDFAASLHQALDLDCDGRPASRQNSRAARTNRDRLLAGLIERSTLSGELMIEGIPAPSASINFGSAGFAYAILRIAQQREDETLLAVADAWSQAALRDVQLSAATAFTAPDLEMAPGLPGKMSLYHSVPGVWCVAALVADAQADDLRRRRAVEAFAAIAATDDARSELVFGLAGLLLGCSFLLDAIGPEPGDERSLLMSVGDAVKRRLLDQVDRLPDLGSAGGSVTLGIAHGCSGVFYSLLQWAQVSRTTVTPDLQTRIEQLAGLAQPAGRGLAWPTSTRRPASSDGMRATWCNGAAGHLHLWLIAHKLMHDPRYLSLARGAAWTIYEATDSGGDLCCGSAGRAYALLRFFRQDGDRIWLDRASELADHAAQTIRHRQLRRDSLYRGEVGVCLLAADLDDPDQARMPLFEPDGADTFGAKTR